MLQLILVMLALVCFLLAAWQPVSPFYNRLVAVGLAALAASMLVLKGLVS